MTKHLSVATIEKIRLAKLGKKASLETRRKMSESHKGKSTYWSVGKKPHNFIDLTGQTHGRLTVLSFAGVRSGQGRWLCSCECDNRVVVTTGALKSHRTQSCGCLQRECAGQYHAQPIAVGTRFGRWTVLREHGRKPLSYLCKCDCGQTRPVRSFQLLNDRSVSCGCASRELQARLHTIHGLCNSPFYNRWYKRLKKRNDARWTLEMESLLYKLQDHCVICGATENLTVDHVKPNILGNGLYPGNAAILCQSCNSIKSKKPLSRLPPDWQYKIAFAAIDFAQEWEYSVVNEL